jgi:uncharacterized protein (DUF2147 family)
MRMFVVAVAAAVLAGAGAASASPVSGTWKAPTKGATIQVYDCGPAVCGRVEDSDDLRANPDLRDVHNKDAALQGRKVRGLVMMTGFKGGPTEWTDGALYDPASGNTYHGSITLNGPDSLSLKGCIFGPLCRSQTWTRVR